MPEIVKIILILPRFQVCGFSRRLGTKKHCFFLRASRGILPNAGLPPHVCLLKIVFFLRALRGVWGFIFHQMQALLSSAFWKDHRMHVLKLQELDWSGLVVRGGSPANRQNFELFYWLWFLICFTGAASRQNVPKRPTPCPNRKSVNSQEELMAKLIFFSRASRGVSLLFPSPGLSEKPSEDPSFGFPRTHFFSALRAESSPMKAFPIMCPGL